MNQKIQKKYFITWKEKTQMVTTEDLRISLLAAEKKWMENLNRLNATIALLKDVDESIEIVNARKKLQENEVRKSNDELM